MILRFLTICLILTGATGLTTADDSAFLGKKNNAWEADLNNGKEARVRRNAAFALGKLGKHAAAAVPSLKKHLREDKAGTVREAAAFALGEIGRESLTSLDDPDLIAVLSAGLKDNETLVRRSSAVALGNLGSTAKSAQAALEAVLDDPKESPVVRQNVAWALGRIGPGTVPSLRKALKDSDLLVRRDAAGSVGLFDFDVARAALPELIACCEVKNSEVRFAVLNVLIKLVDSDDAKLAPAIVQALSDTDAEVRQNAALVLTNIGGKEAVPAIPILVDALKRGNLDVRRKAAAGIRNIGPEAASAVPVLIETLANTDKELRKNVAVALSGIGPKAESAIVNLVQLVADPREDPEVRVQAAFALAKIGAAPAAVKAAPALAQVLQDPKTDTKVREKIVWALRPHKFNLKNIPGVFDAFAKVQSEPNEKDTRMLRYDCAYMLGMLQGPKAPEATLDTLLDFLRDNSIVVFDQRVVKVGTIGEEIKGEGPTLHDKGKGDGRVMAAQALRQIGARVTARKDIMDQLSALAVQPDTLPDLRVQVVECLIGIGRERLVQGKVIDYLRDIAQNKKLDDELRESAKKLLSDLGK